MDVGSTPTISTIKKKRPIKVSFFMQKSRTVWAITYQDFCDGSFVEKVPSLG